MDGTVSISWGPYGGFYVTLGYTKRICLGWVAFTYFPDDIDAYLNDYTGVQPENGTSPSPAPARGYGTLEKRWQRRAQNWEDRWARRPEGNDKIDAAARMDSWQQAVKELQKARDNSAP